VCYLCKGKGHRKRDCLWNHQQTSVPDLRCQICGQYGHGAMNCLRYISQIPPPPLPPRVNSVYYNAGNAPQGNSVYYNAGNAPQGNWYSPRDTSRAPSGGT